MEENKDKNTCNQNVFMWVWGWVWGVCGGHKEIPRHNLVLSTCLLT